MEHLLQVTGLTKVYGKRGAATRALDGVDLSLEAGEYVGIMGASGSGKTTLLNCVSTIDKPTSGSILVEGRELTRLKGKELTRFRRERLGFIFQDCNLLALSSRTATCWTPSPPLKTSLCLCPSWAPRRGRSAPGWRRPPSCWASATV